MNSGFCLFCFVLLQWLEALKKSFSFSSIVTAPRSVVLETLLFNRRQRVIKRPDKCTQSITHSHRPTQINRHNNH